MDLPTRMLRSHPAHSRDAGHRLYGRLLVCVDRSARSESCLSHAVSLADTFGSTITLAHVVPRGRGAGPTSHDALEEDRSRREARAYLERLQRDISRTVEGPVDIRLEQGRPAERIVELASDISADLIVVGSAGAGGAEGHSLGSTALKVVGSAKTSLFIAKTSAKAPPNAKRILVPLDGTPRSESAVAGAARIARAAGAELILVHVVEERVSFSLLPAAADRALARTLAARVEAGATDYLQHVRAELVRDGASVRTLVLRHTSECQCLLELIEREQVDLVVVSSNGAVWDTATTFGTVGASLLTHASAPLLALREDQESDVRLEGSDPERDSSSRLRDSDETA